MTTPTRSLLSGGQIAQYVFDPVTDAIRVEPQVGGSFNTGLVTVPYDDISLTYVASGNGTGQIGTVTYKLGGTQVALLTLTYDSSNRLIDVQKS